MAELTSNEKIELTEKLVSLVFMYGRENVKVSLAAILIVLARDEGGSP